MSISVPVSAAGPRPAAAEIRLVGAAWLAVLAISLWWQQRWGTIPDTSWLIHVGVRMLEGERLYVDVIETNPPFSVWLYLPFVWLARQVGFSPESAVHGLTLAAVLAGLFGAGLVARRGGYLANPWLVRLSPLMLALLVLFPGNAFSERDHIAVALFLPFLVLTAWRAEEGARGRPGLALSAAVGVAGSVLVLVKPHYGLVVAALAVLLWARIGVRQLLRLVEFWVLGVIFVGYLAAIVAFHPEFVLDLYPLLVDTYLQVSSHDRVLRFLPICLLPLVLVWRMGAGRPPSPLVVAALSASLASLAVAAIQAKGWPYHFFASLFFAFMAAGVALAERLARGPGLGDRKERAWAVLAGAVMLACFLPFTTSQKPDSATLASVRATYDAPSVAVVASDIAIGHPFTPMVNGRWISPHHGDWLGGYALLLRERARAAEDAARFEHYDMMLHDFMAAKAEEIDREVPDIILVQKSNPVWTDYLRSAFDFESIFGNYQLLAEDDTVEVYRRRP
ncbi:hypothetical protein GRZ55_01715 [Chelativorans sp. ZYF759]|uniref:hypothetical protein n=1 Tax=Chelativorans sp. ZYF759 TaxID=2692213 RepID=UPI00145FD05F|nr:hypothetical protein [Chelativorans sp. ZYF759]NMG37954.1 hypothetical protein [Chelativorans sp. ZYF759]